MSEYENPNELPQENAHYEYRYIPQPKKKKKNQPWVLTIILP